MSRSASKATAVVPTGETAAPLEPHPVGVELAVPIGEQVHRPLDRAHAEFGQSRFEFLGRLVGGTDDAGQPQEFRHGDLTSAFDLGELPIETYAGAGLFAGMLGRGGGFLMVPVLLYWFGTRTLSAVGTSLVGIMVGGHRNFTRTEKISMGGRLAIAGATLNGRQGP